MGKPSVRFRSMATTLERGTPATALAAPVAFEMADRG
jgi:hypothetical protein